MLNLGKEAADLAQQPTDERVRALQRIVPCSTIRAILKKAGLNRRLCPRLPNWFMVWFVIALGLCCRDSYRQIFRWLQRFRKNCTPGRSTLCEARKRLGIAPLRLLYNAVVKLLALPSTAHAYYRDMRLMSIGGFCHDLADTEDRHACLDGPRADELPGAFPQARVLGLCRKREPMPCGVF